MDNHCQCPIYPNDDHMRTLYLDNNIIAKEVDGSRLPQLLAQGKFRLAISVWNLVEIAKHGDRQEELQRAARIDNFRPKWLFNARDIQADEVMAFIWNQYYQAVYPAQSPFAPSVSSIMWKDLIREMPIVGGAEGWVKELHGQLKIIEEADQDTSDALCVMQNANERAKKTAEPEIFRQWVCTRIKRKLHVKTPSDHYLQVKDIAQLVDFCWGEQVQFYKECPSMAVEERFARIRGKNPKRKPSRNDGRDLQHGIVALPYCDEIISGDGYLRECMRYASEQLSDLKLAKVHDSFEGFLSHASQQPGDEVAH